MLQLVSIKKTPTYARGIRSGKKYVAVFKSTMTGKTFRRFFGDAAYEDYTTHKDAHRRDRYILRHGRREKQHWKNLTTPAALSRFVLWESPNIRTAIAKYRRMVAQKVKKE
jgi:hypothetical protein